MRTVDARERRARLGRRHRLATPAADVVDATRAVLALHSSDPVTVYLSAWARVPGFDVEHLERALYSDRDLIRMYGMRRTLWVVDRDTVPLVHNSTTPSVAERERRRNAKLLERSGVADNGEAWLEKAMPRVIAEIIANGEILTRDLSSRLDGLDRRVEVHSDSGKLQGTFGLASRVVLQLAFESKVVRARPAGSWISGQYRWAEMVDWLGEPIRELPADQASADLIRRWLCCFGPATESDLRWWTGWNLRQVRRSLSDVMAVEVDLGGETGYLLPDDIEPVEDPEPWVALLPSLDPTTMGWKERHWYLGEHGDVLFDRNGNAGPTVWADGRIVGGWAQRKEGGIVFEILDDIGAEATAAVEQTASRLEDWLSDTIVTPRFRSPHDKRLAP